MLTEAMVEISIGSSTGQRPKARNSFASPPRVPGMPDGTKRVIARNATIPITTTAQNAARHPAACPRAVPNGTPSTLASVRPANINDTRLRALLTWHQIAGNDGANSEERAMGKGSDHARGHQQPVIRREGAAEITDREQRHQSQESSLARDACGRHCHDGCADHDAQCITRHEIAGLRDGHRQAARDVGQQAHDDELGRADAERCRSQCENRKG